MKKKQITQSAIEITPSQIGLEEKDEEALVITEADPYTHDEGIYEYMLKHDKYLQTYSIDTSHTVGWMRDTKRVLTSKAFNYDYLYTRVSQNSKYSNFKKGKRYLLSCLSYKRLSTVGTTYDRMLKYCKDEDLNLNVFL